MKKFIFIFLLMGCQEFNPQPPVDQPDLVHDFYQDFEKILAREVDQLPNDKQQHYEISRLIFDSAPVVTSTDFGILLEAFIKTIHVGYQKEIDDLSLTNAVDFRVIYEQILVLDSQIANESLDQKDLMADWLGASASSLRYSMMEIE